MRKILRAMHPRRFRKSIRRAGWIKIAILIIPQRRIILRRIDQGVALGKFLWRDKLLMQPHIPRL